MSSNLMQQTYQAFLNAGMSPNQARAITAEVGRENDFNPSFVFGQHTDANRKVSAPNIGFISWNGARREALIKDLSRQGLLNSDGTIKRGQQSLDAMARFVVQEIRTNPAYAKTKRQFLDNPNVSYDTASRVLGHNYIRWDMAGNTIKNVGSHHAKRDRYYKQLGGVDVAADPSAAARLALNTIQSLGQPTANAVTGDVPGGALGGSFQTASAAPLPQPKPVTAADYDKAFAIPDLNLTQGLIGGDWYSSLGNKLSANRYNAEQNAAMERMFGNPVADAPSYGALPSGLNNYLDKLIRTL